MPQRELITKLPPNPSFDDFKRFDGTLYVRNHSNKAISANDKDNRFLLQPAGSDGDCQILPEHALKLSNFQKIYLRGQISISPDYAGYALESLGRIDAQRDKQIADIQEMTEPDSSKNDLIQTACLVCSDTVFQVVAERDTLVPPLCAHHKGREASFIGTAVQNENGTTEVKFSSTGIN